MRFNPKQGWRKLCVKEPTKHWQKIPSVIEHASRRWTRKFPAFFRADGSFFHSFRCKYFWNEAPNENSSCHSHAFIRNRTRLSWRSPWTTAKCCDMSNTGYGRVFYYFPPLLSPSSLLTTSQFLGVNPMKPLAAPPPPPPSFGCILWKNDFSKQTLW